MCDGFKVSRADRWHDHERHRLMARSVVVHLAANVAGFIAGVRRSRGAGARLVGARRRGNRLSTRHGGGAGGPLALPTGVPPRRGRTRRLGGRTLLDTQTSAGHEAPGVDQVRLGGSASWRTSIGGVGRGG